jgi:hypothetical protein
MYATGDIDGAVRLFLGLLRGSPISRPFLSLPPRLNGEANGPAQPLETDKVYLEDFRTAFAVGNRWSSRFVLYISCLAHSTCNRPLETVKP